MASSPTLPKWYAVHVRSNQEKNTADFVRGRGGEVFLPTYCLQSKRRDRKVQLIKPLFSGYLFVRMDLHSEKRVDVLKAPGTVRIVGFGQEPVPVPDPVIEHLKILVGDGDGPARPHPLVKVGNQVRVISGAFAGVVGILHETEDKKPRLVVQLEFLGRAVAVPIESDQVQPAGC